MTASRVPSPDSAIVAPSSRATTFPVPRSNTRVVSSPATAHRPPPGRNTTSDTSPPGSVRRSTPSAVLQIRTGSSRSEKLYVASQTPSDDSTPRPMRSPAPDRVQRTAPVPTSTSTFSALLAVTRNSG
nr:hypothetical protein GCM10020092_076860 [Actinoplanes digitatis]